jgi:peptide/nickel transport system ATP-binding protein
LQLLKQIQQENGMALWLISHDLALVSNMADRVAVMQSGRIVEAAENKQIFSHAQHQYTQTLLDASPTRAKVFPTCKVKLTSSTALT